MNSSAETLSVLGGNHGLMEVLLLWNLICWQIFFQGEKMSDYDIDTVHKIHWKMSVNRYNRQSLIWEEQTVVESKYIKLCNVLKYSYNVLE